MSPEQHGRWNGTDSPMHETKFCPHCQEQKPIGDFARRRRGSEDRQGWCRDCINATRREARAVRGATSTSEADRAGADASNGGICPHKEDPE